VPQPPAAELPHNIEVPEPAGRRGRARGSHAEPAGEIPGVVGVVGSWIRRHRLESIVFVATVAALSVLAAYLSIDPGPRQPQPLMTVGPPPGQDLAAYVDTRRRALEDIVGVPGRRLAVVTFKSPLTSAQLEGLSIPPGVELQEVIVGDPLGYPESVEGGPRASGAVERWRENRLQILDAQRKGLSEVLAASPSPTPAEEWFRTESQRVDAALAKVRDGAVVLGAIVSGTGDTLVALQSDPSVLLVDLAPAGASAERISFRLASAG
jgi:hypothetical protein